MLLLIGVVSQLGARLTADTPNGSPSSAQISQFEKTKQLLRKFKGEPEPEPEPEPVEASSGPTAVRCASSMCGKENDGTTKRCVFCAVLLPTDAAPIDRGATESRETVQQATDSTPCGAARGRMPLKTQAVRLYIDYIYPCATCITTERLI